MATVWEWIQSGSIPVWAECAGLSPQLHCWQLQVGNLSIDTDGRLWRRRVPPSVGSQLVVPQSERQSMICRFHDSLFAGHLGISRTVFRLQTCVYWPGLRQDIQRMWHLALCASQGNPHASGGRPWDMWLWVAAGRE